MLEIGPHSRGPPSGSDRPPEIIGVGQPTRWTCPGAADSTGAGRSRPAGGSAATPSYSFAPGFTEHTIHIRGSLASATVDLERNTYVLHRHTQYGLDFDHYRMTSYEAGSLAAQARRTFTHYVLSKFKLSTQGSPYGLSIARALQSFYAGIRTQPIAGSRPNWAGM